LFEFLNLDAYAFPFYPREVSLHSHSRAYTLAKEAILRHSQRKNKDDYKELRTVKDKRYEALWSEALAVEESVTAVAEVARVLYDDGNRKVYLDTFLPVLNGYQWWDPFKMGWGRKKWEDEVGNRRKRLSKFCGWKSGS